MDNKSINAGKREGDNRNGLEFSKINPIRHLNHTLTPNTYSFSADIFEHRFPAKLRQHMKDEKEAEFLVETLKKRVEEEVTKLRKQDSAGKNDKL
jgi:hypothetical protein